MNNKIAVAIFIFGFAASVGVTRLTLSPYLQDGQPYVRAGQLEEGDFASEAPAPIDFQAELQRFTEALNAPGFDGKACEALLSRTTARLQVATPQDFAPTPELQAQYRKNGTAFVQQLFSARLLLRDKIKSLALSKTITPACISDARDLYRVSRYLEDLIGEYALGMLTNGNHPVLKGSAPWLLVNSKFGGLQLKSGDVILSRGTAFTSAAIARLGNNDASFSHVSIVYVDPVTHEMSTSEAQIEIGSFNGPISQYLDDGKSRAAVFRFRDPAIASRSAERVRATIAEYLSLNGAPIPYDAAMNDNDGSRWYCSELIARAYQMGSNDSVHLPAYPSQMTPKNPAFIRRLGVKSASAFLPMDIEVDPNFELVAEWRDYSQMNTMHMHDAILSSMYDWMDRGNYAFHDPLKTKVEMNLAYGARRVFMFSSYLQKKVPECLSGDQMTMITTLGQIAQLMYNRLQIANARQMKATGEWLTITQMEDELERYRQEDRKAFLASHGDSGPLHRLFRPGL